jgi:hypothetical protein
LNEHFTANSHPRARIELKRHTDGDKDEDDEPQGKGEGSGSGSGAGGGAGAGAGDSLGPIEPGGTARLLKRFKSSIKVCPRLCWASLTVIIMTKSLIHPVLECGKLMEQSDFILLPCDISPPSTLPLASILDKHRSSPTAVLTALFYEAAEPVKEGRYLE